MNTTPTSALLNQGPKQDGRPALAFRNVSIAFAGPPVLEDISFNVAPGETRVLLGPAGVGKSVLLKLANGLLRPDEGSVLLFGEDIARMREEALFPLRIRTGMVFQEGALFDSLAVRDNVAYQLIQEEVPDDDIDVRVREALRFVGLEQTFSLYPGSLSGEDTLNRAYLGWLTFWVSWALLPPSAVPLTYVAVIVWGPALSVEVVTAAWPATLTATAPRVVAPSVNVTVPVVAALPQPVTDAVNVTPLPNTEGLVLDASVVPVAVQ